MTPVKAVGNVAGGEQEEQAGQKESQPGIAKVQRPVRNGIHLPGHGHRLRLCAKDSNAARPLIEPEVAGGKRLHATPGRLGGK